MKLLWNLLGLLIAGLRAASAIRSATNEDSTLSIEEKKVAVEAALVKFHVSATKYVKTTANTWDDSIAEGIEEFLDELASGYVDAVT